MHGWLGEVDCFVLVKQRERFVEPEFVPAATRDQVTEILSTYMDNVHISTARYTTRQNHQP